MHIEIPRCCLTCEYMETSDMICRNIFSDKEWETVSYDDCCDKWSVDDIAKMIYEGEEDGKATESM